MKNIKNYKAEKYSTSTYKKVEEGIYLTKNPYQDFNNQCNDIYVTSLTFECEPECYMEEDGCPQYIPQYPLEDIMDEFSVYVTDFYDDLNAKSETVCYQEFGSDSLENIQGLRTLIGKRAYEKLLGDYEEDDDDDDQYEFVIE